MQETIHTFIEGMDLDTEKALRSNNVTHLVNNFRLVTNIDGTNGALESIKGNTLFLELEDYFDTLVGHCLVRDTLVLFGTTGITNKTGQIYKVDLSLNIIPSVPIKVYDDSLSVDDSRLNFGSNIKTVGRYESENIVKVYWTDGINPVRFINVAVNNTTDGDVYSSGVNEFIGIDKLEFKSNFLVSEISSLEVKRGGSLEAGIVRYTYQFYNRNGAETTFAPLTNPLHLTESSDTSTSATKYKGSEVDTNTGKSVKINIVHLLDNVGYDYLKVIRIFYSTYGGTPTIDLIADISINKYFTDPYNVYYVVDSGTSLYSYTSEEISILGRSLFSAKDIATKDDLLLFGNIEEDFFDVDFDARAFRFPVSDTVIHIDNDGSSETHTVTADTLTVWDTVLASIGDDNDCINLNNDLTYNDSLGYNYQYNSTTLGGTGRNVKYSFTVDTFILDNKANNIINAANTTIQILDADLIGSSTGNYSFSNYASPYMSNMYRGYQRGEVYRFGIIFYDVKGRASKVKWVGDIKFPSLKDLGYTGLAGLDTGKIESDILGIEFYVRNVPTDAVAWSIVRVPRTDNDKTIISQGVISSTVDYGNLWYLPVFPTLKTTSTAYKDGTLQNSILCYMSPDINYGEFDYRDGDYFETVGHFTSYGTYADQDDRGDYNIIKFCSFTRSTSTDKITPNKIVNVTPASPANIYALGVEEVDAYINDDNGVDSVKGILGSCVLFTYNEANPVISSSVNEYAPAVVNLRRINNSQYGGNTFENRSSSSYITCGEIVTKNSASFTYDESYVTKNTVRGGDIFITMYERLHGMYYDNVAEICRICYMPLESKYNLSLNSGFTHSRNVGNDADLLLIRENAGTHSAGASVVLEQTEDFYIYNTVYSYDDSIVHYFPASILDNTVTDYDTRIVVSDKKINNEIIDSWTLFGANNFIDVDTTYGELNNLTNFKNKIFFHQEQAFGMLSINDRSLVADSTSASGLVLGTGGVLDRYDYISTQYGNLHSYGITQSESGLYWIDTIKNELVVFNGEGLNPLSKTKKIDKFFKDNYNNISKVQSVFNSKYNEVWFKLDNFAIDLGLLVYNEQFDCFTGFYTIPAQYFIPLKNEIVTKNRVIGQDSLYLEDSNDTRGNFYGVQYPSYISILHTEGYPHVKVYDNIAFASTTKNSIGTNIFATSFNTLQVYNDYQNTGIVTLSKSTNLERKERIWTTFVPRNAVNKNVSLDEDIFDSSNLSTSQTYKDRIRDNYAMFKFVYNNTSGDYSFYIPYVIIKYRQSIR